MAEKQRSRNFNFNIKLLTNIMMNIKKTIALTVVVAGVLLVAAPAKAFYLELPNVLKFWQGAAKAQEAPALTPAPAPAEPVQAPTPVVEPQLAPAPALIRSRLQRQQNHPAARRCEGGRVKSIAAPMPLPTEPPGRRR